MQSHPDDDAADTGPDSPRPGGPSPEWLARQWPLVRRRLAIWRERGGAALYQVRWRARDGLERLSPLLHRGRDALRPAIQRFFTWLRPGCAAILAWLAALWLSVAARLKVERPLAPVRISPPRSARGRLRAVALVALLALTVVFPCALPGLVALNDYEQARVLGDAGVLHLMNAQRRLAGLFALADLQGQFMPPLGTTSSAPYTYLLQRQAGTAYNVTVTIHPAPQMAALGLHDATLSATLDRNATLGYGLPPSARRARDAAFAQAADAESSASATPTAPPALPNAADLRAAADELRAAQSDFGRLRANLRQPDLVLRSAAAFPGMESRLATVATLADAGYDLATVGRDLITAAQPLLDRARTGVLAGGSDLITQGDVDGLRQALERAVRSLDAIGARLGTLDLRAAPLSETQITLLTRELRQLPRFAAAGRQALAWLPAVAWLLGVGQPRHFLVQTLDRAELRPSGGFTGDYGVLTIANGRAQPFELYNINDIEYGYKTNGWIFGKRPPAEYSWWPFANWGLRDSNLSPDFPTTAKINIQLFKNEGQGDVDGVIQLTPTLIAHLLRITGPLYVPGYDETITADNLEQRIHYYQQDPAGIAKQRQLNPDDHTHSLRKRFTQLVTRLLEEKVRQLPHAQLLALARQIVDDLRAKELQIYVTNPQVEDILRQRHVAGAVEAAPSVDTYLLTQANVSVAKSTPYVQVTQHDDVTLDNNGGAAHALTITLRNDPSGPIYGLPTYRDYLRVYAPEQARFTAGWGFDQLTPLCRTNPPAPPPAPTPTATPAATTPKGPPNPAPVQQPTPTPTPPPTPPPDPFGYLPVCSANPYPGGERVCPAGYFADGGEAERVLDWNGGKVPRLGAVGPPTNTRSDLPGMAMRGGYVMIPQGCAARVTLRWYVPGVVQTLG